MQQFVDWLTTRPGRGGRLCDRSIANALTPVRLALDAAVAEGLLDANPAEQVVLLRRRAGRAWSTRERRFLTRAELVRLLDEVPVKWRPLFELLAATGLRISEAIGLCWSDLVLDSDTPHLQVRRAIVKGAAVAPKSRHGARLIPLTPELAATLRAHRPHNAVEAAFVFPGRDETPRVVSERFEPPNEGLSIRPASACAPDGSKPPANCVAVNPRGNLSNASGFAHVSAMIRSRINGDLRYLRRSFARSHAHMRMDAE